jgi:DNA replication initiation complex subunit (GINS family)
MLFDDEIGLFKPLKEPEKVAEDSAKKILVRVLRDVPSFVGADLKTYGPYKTEDVVLLPAQNAEALIKREIATEIKRRI